MDKTEQDKAEGKKIVWMLSKSVLKGVALAFRLVFVNIKFLLVLLAVLAAILGTVYVAKSKPELLGIPKDQQIVDSQADISNLIKEVGKIIVLPDGETPTVATVTDLEKVKNQDFFARAQNGDKILIYPKAKKAFLYRPSEKKIIEVGMVNIQEKSDNQAINPTLTPSPTSPGSSTTTPTPNNPTVTPILTE